MSISYEHVADFNFTSEFEDTDFQIFRLKFCLFFHLLVVKLCQSSARGVFLKVGLENSEFVNSEMRDTGFSVLERGHLNSESVTVVTDSVKLTLLTDRFF